MYRYLRLALQFYNTVDMPLHVDKLSWSANRMPQGWISPSYLEVLSQAQDNIFPPESRVPLLIPTILDQWTSRTTKASMYTVRSRVTWDITSDGDRKNHWPPNYTPANEYKVAHDV